MMYAIASGEYQTDVLYKLSCTASDECAGQFVCTDGGEYGKAECLAASRVCDGHSDCGNGADEQGCGRTSLFVVEQGFVIHFQ